MALTFPVSPLLNDIYTYGNMSWKWNGSAWIKQSSAVSYETAVSVPNSFKTASFSDAKSATPSYLYNLINKTMDSTVVKMNSYYGLTGNGTEDVSAFLQEVLTSGKIAEFSSGTYLIGTTVVSDNFRIRSTGSKGSCIFKPTAAITTGYVFETTGIYQIQNISLVGNGVVNVHGIGTLQTKAVGGFVRDCTISAFDCCILFGGDSYHPNGAYYANTTITKYIVGGLVIGSPESTSTATEDGIGLTGVYIDNSDQQQAETTFTKTSTTTIDTISWTAPTTYPRFGYIVVRSSDNATNWHIPPNWNSILFKSNTFAASKTSGQTWYYKVLTASYGAVFSHTKNVSITNGHLGEQSTIGCLFYKVKSATIASGHFESALGSQGSVGGGKGPFAAVAAYQSDVNVNTLWVDNAAYAILSLYDSIVTAANISFDTSKSKSYAYFGVGGAGTKQTFNYTGKRDTSMNLPISKSLTSSISDNDRYTNIHTPTVRQIDLSGSSIAKISTSYKGSEGAYMQTDSYGGFLYANNLNVAYGLKTGISPLITPSQSTWTSLTPAVATDVLRFPIPNIGTPNNIAGTLTLLYNIRVLYDGNVVQSASSTAVINYLSKADANYSKLTSLNTVSNIILGEVNSVFSMSATVPVVNVTDPTYGTVTPYIYFKVTVSPTNSTTTSTPEIWFTGAIIAGLGDVPSQIEFL